MSSAKSRLKPTMFIDAMPELREASMATRRDAANAKRAKERGRRRGQAKGRGEGRGEQTSGTHKAAVVFLVAAVSLSAGCSSKRVLMPPRVDLTEHYRVGLVTFTIENAKGSLHELATERFMTDVLGGQPGIEILELGDAAAVLAEIGEADLGPRAAQRIGDSYDVPVVFFGHLQVSDVKPRGQLVGLQLPHLEANVTVDMRVRLLSTESGGTLWSNSARATETVGQVGFDGSMPYFSAEDPNEAYGRLVDYLVNRVSADFKPYWVKQ